MTEEAILHEFLNIAGALGLLTYTIGALIYGLPIPSRGLKEWGSKMIKDGVYAMFWVMFYNVIVSLISNFASPLWDNYLTWLYQMMFELIFFDTAFSGLSRALPLIKSASITINKYTSITINFPKSFPRTPSVSSGTLLSLGSSFLSNGASLFTVLMVLSLVVLENWELFLAIGIMLISTPFRIGRSAGATLTAFSLVFYAGLPFLPVFVAGVDLLSALYLANGNELAEAVYFMIDQNIPFEMIEITGYMIFLVGVSASVAEVIGEYGRRAPLGIDIVL